jgi:hypothetical protein
MVGQFQLAAVRALDQGGLYYLVMSASLPTPCPRVSSFWECHKVLSFSSFPLIQNTILIVVE